MTQLIGVIHNPILIYKLSKLERINIIELTDGYLEEIKDVFSDDEVLKLAAQTLGISRAKLLELVANEKEDIGAQPVRVTRCKDCRFWQGVGDNGSCCTGAGIDDFTDADDYCSRGRKANGASCRER